MNFAIASTLTLTMLTGAQGLTGDNLANCFSRCESNYSGSALADCRSDCRADEDWEQGGSGRDYKNRRNPSSRKSRRRCRNCDEEEIDTVIKGMVPIKDKQLLVGLDKDEDSGGDSKDSGSKENDTDSKDDSKEKDSDSKDNSTDDSKEKDSEASDKDDRDIDKPDPDEPIAPEPDDDCKDKDGCDDKKKDDDDDDEKKKKDKDDDDDDYTKRILPNCEIDGQNYHRCESPVESKDANTCDEIAKDCKDKAIDQKYCECIGLGQKEATLRGAIQTSF